MALKGLHSPEAVEKEKVPRMKHRMMMKKDKKKGMLGNFGRKMLKNDRY